jgi:hypothetical protein
MKVISMATAKRQTDAARNGLNGRSRDPEIVRYRRLLRAHVKRLERRALAGPQSDPARIDAIKSLGALVLAMYVAEHNLREDMHRAIEATLVA